MSHSNYRKKGCSLLEKLDNYTVIDLETTGRNTHTCDIIELAAVRIRNNIIADTFSTFVNPHCILPYEIIKLTGITNQMVSGAPNINECLQNFIEFVGDDVLLGHNISTFDIKVLNRIAYSKLTQYIMNDYLDTLEYSRHCDIDVPNHKLSTLQTYFKINNTSQHRALSDCIANHECYQKMKPLFSRHFYNTQTYGKSEKKKQEKIVINYSQNTNSLIKLKELLYEVTLDGKITEEEVAMLKTWLNENHHLAGNYPFDIVYSNIEKVLEDGILEPSELEELFNIFQEAFDPVNKAAKRNVNSIEFNEKTVCLSGEFKYFDSKEKVEEVLKSKGAIIKKTVIKSLDYLIVGDKGSDAWSSGNYGTKIKKALEWNEKGANIQILKEDEIWQTKKTIVNV